MGLLKKLAKVATSARQKDDQAPKAINEIREENRTIVTFEDGFELEWKDVESRRAIFNLEASKVPSFTSERVDLEGGILTIEDKQASYLRDGIAVFTVTSRMKAYKELEEWSGCHVKRFIAERRSGDYGSFYKVWMYFGEKLDR